MRHPPFTVQATTWPQSHTSTYHKLEGKPGPRTREAVVIHSSILALPFDFGLINTSDGFCAIVIDLE